MDTRLATKELHLQEWSRIIQDCKSSGLTIEDYCKQHQLSRNSYFYWKRLVKQALLKQSGIEFYEVPDAPPKEPVRSSIESSAFKPEAVIRSGNFSIEVNSSTSRELLSMLCGVLADA